jgi:hypothetical protein
LVLFSPASGRRTRLADVPDSHITQNAVTVTNDEKTAAEWLYSENQSITTGFAAKCAVFFYLKMEDQNNNTQNQNKKALQF